MRRQDLRETGAETGATTHVKDRQPQLSEPNLGAGVVAFAGGRVVGNPAQAAVGGGRGSQVHRMVLQV